MRWEDVNQCPFRGLFLECRGLDPLRFVWDIKAVRVAVIVRLPTAQP